MVASEKFSGFFFHIGILHDGMFLVENEFELGEFGFVVGDFEGDFGPRDAAEDFEGEERVFEFGESVGFDFGLGFFEVFLGSCGEFTIETVAFFAEDCDVNAEFPCDFGLVAGAFDFVFDVA